MTKMNEMRDMTRGMKKRMICSSFLLMMNCIAMNGALALVVERKCGHRSELQLMIGMTASCFFFGACFSFVT